MSGVTLCALLLLSHSSATGTYCSKSCSIMSLVFESSCESAPSVSTHVCTYGRQPTSDSLR